MWKKIERQDGMTIDVKASKKLKKMGKKPFIFQGKTLQNSYICEPFLH